MIQNLFIFTFLIFCIGEKMDVIILYLFVGVVVSLFGIGIKTGFVTNAILGLVNLFLSSIVLTSDFTRTVKTGEKVIENTTEIIYETQVIEVPSILGFGLLALSLVQLAGSILYFSVKN